MRVYTYRPTGLPGLVNALWEQSSEDAARGRIAPSGWVELIFRLGPEFSLQKARRLRSRSDLGMAERMRKLATSLPIRAGAPVRELAHRLGYSRSHAHRVFTEWLGQSATELTRLTRFVRAVHALQHDDATLTEIGYRLGYYDQLRCTPVTRCRSWIRPSPSKRPTILDSPERSHWPAPPSCCSAPASGPRPARISTAR